jgi:FkbM family methyltransferase
MFQAIKLFALRQLKRKGYQLSRDKDPFSEQQRLLACRPPALVIDIGANRGETVAAYRHRFPRATIYAFEPFPEHAAFLKDRFRDDPHIAIIEAAVGQRSGKALLNVSAGKSTHSLLNRPASGLRYLPERAVVKGQIEVPVVSLDEFCRERDVASIDALKVDVEGAEIQVLKGSHQLLNEQRVGLILSEVMFVEHYADQPLYFDIAKLLSTYGYGVYDLFDLRWSRQNAQLRFANALFLSPALRDQISRL